MHGMLLARFMVVASFVFYYCGELHADGGNKPGKYSFFIAFINPEGQEHHSLEHILDISEISTEESGDDSSQPETVGTGNDEAGEDQLNYHRFSVEEAGAPPDTENEGSLPDKTGESQEEASSVTTTEPGIYIITGENYVVNQYLQTVPAVNSLPTVGIQFDFCNPSNFIGAFPLDQVISPLTPNTIFQLHPLFPIQVNLPIIEHVATGTVVYPVFILSGILLPPDNHQGLIIQAFPHPCCSYLCPTCQQLPDQSLENNDCACCHCCQEHQGYEQGSASSGDEDEDEDSKGVNLIADIIVCNDPVSPDPGSPLSAPLPDDVSPPGISVPPPSIPDANQQYSVTITLTPDNSAVASASYQFANGDLVIIYMQHTPQPPSAEQDISNLAKIIAEFAMLSTIAKLPGPKNP